jgi:hypothetical protein
VNKTLEIASTILGQGQPDLLLLHQGGKALSAFDGLMHLPEGVIGHRAEVLCALRTAQADIFCAL